MRKVNYYKCPCCGMKYKSLGPWGNHMRMHHDDWCILGYSDMRLFYYAQTGRVTGRCIVCHEDTEWNESLGKYDRFCTNPDCKEKYREMFKKRMVDKYGRVHLLNDPEQQRKMLKNRRISGTIKFKDGGLDYVGSYEADFLKMMRDFLHFSAKDIMAPSPHTYTYKFNNENHFYIPDFYIPDLNLEVEVKDHETTHPKFIAVDFKKEAAKTEMMNQLNDIEYIVVPDKDYQGFFIKVEELRSSIPVYDIPKSNKDKKNIALEQLTRNFKDIDKSINIVMEQFNSSILENKRTFSGYILHSDDIKLSQEKLTLDRPAIESALYPKLNKYYAVYIGLTYADTLLSNIIKWYTTDDYTHSMLSFDPSFNDIYSFGTKNISGVGLDKFGFVEDGIHNDFYKVRHNIHFAVYTVFVNEYEHNNMLQYLQYFKKNAASFRYDSVGLIKYIAKINSTDPFKYFCSGFVADVLQAGGYAEDKHYSRFAPSDFALLPNSYKVADVRDINDYDPIAAISEIKKSFAKFCVDTEIPLKDNKLMNVKSKG